MDYCPTLFLCLKLTADRDIRQPNQSFLMKNIFILLLFSCVLDLNAQQNPSEIQSDMSEILNSQSNLITLYTADEYFQLDSLEEALSRYNIIYNDFNDPYIFFKKGVCEFGLDNNRAAVVSFTKCLDLTNFTKANYKDKKWKNSEAQFNILDAFGGLFISQDSSGSWIARPSLPIKYQKSDIYLYRAVAKCNLNDFFGCVEDIQSYHRLTNDSNQVSNYYYGFCLMKLKKLKEAKKYFTISINYYRKRGRFNDNESVNCRTSFYRGLVNHNLGFHEDGCLDLSHAGQLGYVDAYGYIEEYCHH